MNRDICVTAALLHDIGKLFTYSNDNKPPPDYFFVGHFATGFNFVDGIIKTIEDFPVNIQKEISHVILSHHGAVKNGWGSVIDPKTLIAITVHHCDLLSSRLAKMSRDLTSFYL